MRITTDTGSQANQRLPARLVPGRSHARRRAFVWFSAALLFAVLTDFGWAAAGEPGEIDWDRAIRLQPELKLLVLVEGDRPISLGDLAALSDAGMVPADRDPGLVVGLRSAVFTTRAKKWLNGAGLPRHLRGRLLSRFYMNGIYRVNFKVEEKGYTGPLTLEITAPRDGFGRKLLHSESIVRPRTRGEMRTDIAGNRWFCVEYPEVAFGRTIRFHFAFRYLVDMQALLKHDVNLTDHHPGASTSPGVLPFLEPGYKINPDSPQARAWAARGGSVPPDCRKEYKRLEKFLKSTVAYDTPKRLRYFGGKAVYRDVDEMYQDMDVTLSRRVGACPDTVLLECAFLRARGIPCKTAGRFGHFFSLVHVPGTGWVSTSVTPTGIPLIISPGADHLPYQNWTPRIALRTSLWEARIRIQPLED